MTRIHHWIATQLRGIDWTAWIAALGLALIASVFVGMPMGML